MRKRKDPIEELPPLDKFLDLYVEQTYDQSDFLGTPLLWTAILRAAREEPSATEVWGRSRLQIMRYIGRRYGLPPVVHRHVPASALSIPISEGIMTGWVGMRLLNRDISRPKYRVNGRWL